MQPRRTSLRSVLRAVAIILTTTLTLTAVGVLAGTSPAAAEKKPCAVEDPTCPTPGGEGGPFDYKPAVVDLDYRLNDRAGEWKQAWKSLDEKKPATKPWKAETYDPRYVFPTSYGATFYNQCVDKIDFDKELNDGDSTVNTYRWKVGNAPATAFRKCFRTALSFPSQGTHTVRLDVISPGGQTLVTKQRTVKVVDHVVVLLGDSMASGEGAPEHNRTPKETYGTWIDRRCHRSSWAAVPRAVAELEGKDPYSTVTFLNFACSGATLGDYVLGQGSGVLGPYNGIEPPVEFEKGDEIADPTIAAKHYLPSQVDQLAIALGVKTRNGTKAAPGRTVDKLFTSAGINDVRFAEMSKACIVETYCIDKPSGLYGDGQKSVADTMAQLAGDIPARWGLLDKALQQKSIQTVPGSRYVMQYPDAFTAGDATRCTEMLADVVPQATAVFLVSVLIVFLAVLIAFPATSPIGVAALILLTTTIHGLGGELGINLWDVIFNGVAGDLRWSREEIQWLSSTGNQLLDDANRAGAVNGNFTFIDGIAGLFVRHGYCATDNWLNTAPESSFNQGPWDFASHPLGVNLNKNGVSFGLDIHIRTKGLMHPNRSGYKAAGDFLAAPLGNLIAWAPVGVGDGYDLDLNTSSVLNVPASSGVLANDTDANGDTLKVFTFTQPPNGAVNMKPDGSFTYTPKPGFEGWDNFTYRATDGALETAVTPVSIHVLDTNGPDWSWTIPQGLTVKVGGTVTFPVCKDCGWLDLRANPGPTMGTVKVNRIGPDWSATYTSDPTLVGTPPVIDHLVLELREAKDIGVYELRGAAEVPITVVAGDFRWTHPTPAATTLNTAVTFEMCENCDNLVPVLSGRSLPVYGGVVFQRSGTTWRATYTPNPELSPATPLYLDAFGVQMLAGETVVQGTTINVQILSPPR